MLELILDDSTIFNIKIIANPVSEYAIRSFKHLQSLAIPFKLFDHLKYNIKHKDLLYQTLITSASKLNIVVDQSKLTDQLYLNSLHKIYEKGYNRGDPTWLDFHEMIHAFEYLMSSDIERIHDLITINYRNFAGPLEKPFDIKYLDHAIQTIPKGTCYCTWSELGKIPYVYYHDSEPSDIERICQLAKPWLTLRPSFLIALEDIDLRLTSEQQQGFNEWFSKYKDQWMQYWNLESWNELEMNSVIPIGTISDIDQFKEKMYKNIRPSRINVR